MVSKKIIIEEGQYQRQFERFNGGLLLTEMPYSPSDYSSDCAVHAVLHIYT